MAILIERKINLFFVDVFFFYADDGENSRFLS